jgi:23S rRNA (pseudouridine1915-N3)-methyltransferase
MRLVLLFVGKTRERYIDEGIRDYLERLRRYVATEIVVVKEVKPGKLNDALIREMEATRLLEHCPPGALRVALDPGGRAVDSEELSRLLADWEMRAMKTVAFCIGGFLGLDPALVRGADLSLSLSRLTFTHEMSRLILTEQLYRGHTIKAGHNYHK